MTLPTRVGGADWSAVLPAFEGGTTVSVGDPDSDGLDELTVDFPNSASMTVYCTPVGIGGAPPSGAADLASPSGGRGGGGGAPTPTLTPTPAPGSDVSSAAVADLGGANNQNSQAQDIAFTLGDDLASGEQVTLDLSSAQGPGTNSIDYSGASVAGTSAGSAAFSTQGNNDAVIAYTADGSETSGDTVTVSIDGVDPGNNADGESFTATVTGADGSSSSASFSVT